MCFQSRYDSDKFDLNYFNYSTNSCDFFFRKSISMIIVFNIVRRKKSGLLVIFHVQYLLWCDVHLRTIFCESY